MPFSKTWNEASPTTLDAANAINTYITDDKIAVRERLESLLGIADFSTRYPMSADALKMNGAANTKILGGTASFAITDSTGATPRFTVDTTNGAVTAGSTVTGTYFQSTGTGSGGGLRASNIIFTALAQVNGPAVGFNIFTPEQSKSYKITVFGKDAATPSNAYVDEIVVYSTGTVTITVIHSTTTVGTPGARTYSNNAGALKVAHGNGTTWYVDVAYLVNNTN